MTWESSMVTSHEEPMLMHHVTTPHDIGLVPKMTQR